MGRYFKKCKPSKNIQKLVPGSHLEHLGRSGWICVDLGGYFKKCKPSKNIAKTSPRESFGASGWIWVDLDGSWVWVGLGGVRGLANLVGR